MMESNNPNPQVANPPVEEEDPLLELARIVSGDDLPPKSGPAITPQADGEQTQPAPPELQDEAAGSMLDKELEAALLDDLSSAEPPAEVPSMLPPQSAVAAEEPVVSAPAEPQAAPPIVEPEVPVMEPALDVPEDPMNSMAEIQSNEQKLEEFESSLEQQLLDEIDAEVGADDGQLQPQEPQNYQAGVLSDPPETMQETSVSPATGGELQASEAAPVSPPPIVAREPEIPNEQPDMTSHDPVDMIEQAVFEEQPEDTVTEEDLGKIFAAEFEQINAEHSGEDQASDLASEFEQIQVETVPSHGEMAFLDSETQQTATGADELNETDQLFDIAAGAGSEIAESQDILGELDAEFASAFNDELVQNEILTAAKMGETGWDDQISEDAAMEFAAAVPGMATGVTGAPPLQEPEHLTDPSLLDEPDTAAGVLASEDRAGSNSGIKMAAIALGVALFAGLGAVSYGYMTGESGSSGPIIVKADSEPVKVKPANPGGRKVANQDKASYKKVAGDSEANEQAALVSNKEVARVIAPKQQKPLNTIGERIEPVGEAQVANAKPSMTPRKVRTFTVKPDGTIIAPEPVAEPTAETSGDEAQVLALQTEDGSQATRSLDPINPESGTPQTPSVTTDEGTIVDDALKETSLVEPVNPEDDPGRIDGATSTGAIGVPSRSPLPKPVATQQTQPKPKVQTSQQEPVQIANLNNQESASAVASSPWVVQISSQKSEAAALSSLKNLQRRFPSLLNGRQANIKEAAISGKGTFYRVRVNTQSRDDAGKFCARFKAAGGSCFVTR